LVAREDLGGPWKVNNKTVFNPIRAKVLQKSIKLIKKILHPDLDVINYGEFKYDLRKFLSPYHFKN
jgi:hypothetical protein